jgi:two-component system OmpR family response regulator
MADRIDPFYPLVMKVLVVEDDAETAAYVARGLKEQGHGVDVASDGRDGLFLALDQSFDVIIMDRMIPGMDGLSIVKSLRAGGVVTPVIFLTALGGVGDRVEGLEAGADDYLVKPFSFSELNARVNALGRRAPLREQANAVLKLGALELNRLQRSARVGDKALDLKPKEFQLLEYMMLNADRVVTRTMLLEHVWDFHFDPKTTIVETHISRIRAKLEACGPEAPSIQTVRGAGYMFVAG